MHTSTVTVAVLYQTEKQTVWDQRRDEDFTYRLFSGTGAGGQHRNKHQNSVVMTHVPSGLTQTAVSRSKETNLKDAKERLLVLLDQHKAESHHGGQNTTRAVQIGCGMRGDKKRTYRFQDDKIADHETGRETNCKRFMRGDIEVLWR